MVSEYITNMNYKVIANIDLDHVAELPVFQWRSNLQQQLQEKIGRAHV